MENSFLINPDPGFNVNVTNEDFNLFHNIDRQLFRRLVTLGRDTSQSTHVMAFIMWVEKKIQDDKTIAKLLRWPEGMLNTLVDECVIVLNCIESSHFSYTNERTLPLLQNLMLCTVTLEYFYVIRLEVIAGATKFLNDVCMRAFSDIVQQVQHEKAVKEQNLYLANVCGEIPYDTPQPAQVVYYAPPLAIVPQQIDVPQWINNGESTNTALGTYGASGLNNFNRDIAEILDKLDLNDVSDDMNAIVANKKKKEWEMDMDNRTIFMTFSRGYPISESELREFFTRIYGDVAEAIFLQDVEPPEQPLYARFVVRRETMYVIDHFLQSNGKIKFSINGKHVCARKFVRKSSPPLPHEAGPSHW